MTPGGRRDALGLRLARSTDAGRLGAMLTAAILSRPWKPRLYSGAQEIAFVARMIDRGWVTVAADGADAPLGFAAREQDHIHALYVAPATQRVGVGSALLGDAQSTCARLTLWTFEANGGARRFYERAGFVAVDRTDGANEEGLPDILYHWERSVA